VSRPVIPRKVAKMFMHGDHMAGGAASSRRNGDFDQLERRSPMAPCNHVDDIVLMPCPESSLLLLRLGDVLLRDVSGECRGRSAEGPSPAQSAV